MDNFTLRSFACGGLVLLALALLILMHVPNSPLRTIARRAAAGLFALGLPVHVISPIDALPEAALGPIGLVDDVAAVIAGVVARRNALKGPAQKH